MNEQDVQKIIARAEALAKEGKQEESEQVLREAIADEQRQPMPVHQLTAVADFVQRAVDVALSEIVRTATAMDAKVVPVAFIEMLIGEQATGVRQLWASVERLEVPVDYGVPSDLSELEDL